jgi:hypothetical protein
MCGQTPGASTVWAAVVAGGTVSPPSLATRQKLAIGFIRPLTRTWLLLDVSIWGAARESSAMTNAFGGAQFLVASRMLKTHGVAAKVAEGFDTDVAKHPLSWHHEVAAYKAVSAGGSLSIFVLHELHVGTHVEQALKTGLWIRVAEGVSLVPHYEWHRSGTSIESRAYAALVYTHTVRRMKKCSQPEVGPRGQPME